MLRRLTQQSADVFAWKAPHFAVLAATACLFLNTAVAQDEPPAGKPAAETAPPADEADKPVEPAAKSAIPPLPKSFRILRDLPEAASNNNEWEFEPPARNDDEKKKRERAARILKSKYGTLIYKSAIKTKAEEALVREYVQRRLAEMTLKTTRDSNRVHIIVKYLLRDLARAGTARGANRTGRDFLLKVLVEETPKLFDDYHFVARLNGAILLSRLKLDAKKDPLYQPAAAPLLKFLKDQKQLPAARIPAVRGLGNFALDLKTPAPVKFQIIEAFVNELSQPVPPLNNGKPPRQNVFRMVIADELGQIGVPADRAGKPIVVQALAEGLANQRLNLLARSECAEAIGQLPLNNTINVDLIAYEIGRLTLHMGQASVKQPKKNFRMCAYRLYLALHRLKKKNPRVSSVYTAAFPVILNAFEQKPVDTLIPALDKWLKESTNQPQNRRVHPGAQPIITDQRTAVGTVGSQSGG